MSSRVKQTESTNQLIADYLANTQADQTQIQQLSDELKDLLNQEASLEKQIAALEEMFGDSPAVDQMQAQLKALQAKAQGVINQLNLLDPGLAPLTSAIQALQNDMYSIATGQTENIGQDFAMFSQYYNQLCDAMVYQAKVDQYLDHMSLDGDNELALIGDANKAAQVATQENGILSSLYATMENNLVTLNDQKNKAQTDLNSYRWYDDVFSFGTDEADKERDRAIVRNSDAMMGDITDLMSQFAPAMASLENQIFLSATVSMDQIAKKLLALLKDSSLNPQEKSDQIKYLMAMALGILSLIQTDAAQQKGKNQQDQSDGTLTAEKMNISNQQAQMKQLEDDLEYAKQMGTLMKVAKPLMEVAGCALAPGMGSFLVMVLFAIADEANLTDKLTNELAKTALGKVGAEVLVGALETTAAVGGGAALDRALSAAGEKALAVAAQETSATVAKAIDTAVEKALVQSNKVGDEAAEKAVRQVVEKTVNDAVASAVKKAVLRFNDQAATSLIPQLLKAGAKEGTLSPAAMLAKAAEENCIKAATQAARTASEDVSFIAQAAAYGADVTKDIETISNRAANRAVGKLTGQSAEETAAATDKTATKKALTRGGSAAAYAALSNGALSATIEEILKKAKMNKNGDEFQNIANMIKVLESILASMALMYGTGVLQSTVMQMSMPNLLTAASGLQIAGTGATAISAGGSAEAQLKQADALQAINESSVTNDMLQNLLKEYKSQGDLDQQTLSAQMAEQASTYSMISQLENNGKEAARVLVEQSV